MAKKNYFFKISFIHSTTNVENDYTFIASVDFATTATTDDLKNYLYSNSYLPAGAVANNIKIEDIQLIQGSTGGGSYTLPNAVLQVDPNIGTTAIAVRDTAGNTAPLKLGTSKVEIVPPSSTGSDATPALNITKTLNTTGNPDVICLDVLNTASGATTNLLNLKVGGTSLFSVSKAGAIVTAAGITSTATIQQSSTSDFRWNNRSRLFSDANGNIRLSNSALTDFGLLQLGGTTSAFPAIKRNGANMQARLADDSALTFIEDLYRRAGSGTPEGVVTAPIGAIYHRTDGGASTSLYVKESGAGNTGWKEK